MAVLRLARTADAHALLRAWWRDATAADRLTVRDDNDDFGGPLARTRRAHRAAEFERAGLFHAARHPIGQSSRFTVISPASQAVRRDDPRGHPVAGVRIRDLDANHQSWLK